MEQTSDGSASACFKTSYAEHLPYLGMDLNQKHNLLFIPGMHCAKQNVVVESSEFREAAGKSNTNVGWLSCFSVCLMY